MSTIAPLKYLAESISVGIVITPAVWYVNEGGIPALRGVNIRPGRIVKDGLVQISHDGHAANKKSRLRAGDLVVVRTGQAGAAAVVPVELDGSNCIDLIIIRPGCKLVPRYLEYVLNSGYSRRRISEQSVGSIQSHFNVGAMRDMPIPVPALEEQLRIVKFLDSECSRLTDSAQALRRQIELLESREDSVLHELTSVNSAPAARIKHVVSRLTSGPRGWGELVGDSGVPFIRIANIPRRGIALSLEDLAYVDPPAGSERERTRTQVGDVLVSITADIGSVGVIDAHTVDGNVSQHICLLRARESICHPRWLAYAIKAPAANRALRMSSYGGAKVGLGLAEVAETSISLPNLSTQAHHIKLIDEALSWNEALRGQLTKKLALISEWKQALVDAAVTGQIDVATARGA
ncbi:restriction endonuclease subunit S [Microbispora sp. H10949]|uniref:restriction endonuclease subunit S n=1 Tax=Microbispora sp. H10949 TaxID=2729111 RepID=UPI001600F0ED|nr:restriction endonuclease subunit S [Microbispora sp. H10949]